ncbi:uncharacterized protein LOC143008223 [Genypterus blacodes]|uniref:uncharacterized protein LOC143008223 n=1 Tax=Genypterus blacodes TaxID=154954 RepID=UPI003F77610C
MDRQHCAFPSLQYVSINVPWMRKEKMLLGVEKVLLEMSKVQDDDRMTSELQRLQQEVIFWRGRLTDESARRSKEELLKQQAMEQLSVMTERAKECNKVKKHFLRQAKLVNEENQRLKDLTEKSTVDFAAYLTARRAINKKKKKTVLLGELEELVIKHKEAVEAFSAQLNEEADKNEFLAAELKLHVEKSVALAADLQGQKQNKIALQKNLDALRTCLKESQRKATELEGLSVRREKAAAAVATQLREEVHKNEVLAAELKAQKDNSMVLQRDLDQLRSLCEASQYKAPE